MTARGPDRHAGQDEAAMPLMIYHLLREVTGGSPKPPEVHEVLRHLDAQAP